MPFTPRPKAAVYLSTLGAYCRGSRPSSPAITSSSRALSATVRVIGPVWSMVISIGMMPVRSEEHTSELQSLMRISYAVFCLKQKIYYILREQIKKQTEENNK